MTIATERDTIGLKDEFGVETYPQARDEENALFNWMLITHRVLESNRQLPTLWEMETLQGVHVYLVFEGTVYNRSVTWPDDSFPDFDYPELQQNGRDVTSEYVFGVLCELLGGCLETGLGGIANRACQVLAIDARRCLRILWQGLEAS